MSEMQREDAGEMVDRRGLRPTSCVRGELRVPGSKSIAQRALVIAATCAEPTRISGLPRGADVDRARSVIQVVGARVEALAPAAVRVFGVPPGPHRGWRATRPLEVGESGTLARFALGVAGLCGRAGERFEIVPSGSLATRRSDALIEALRAAGVVFERTEWPIVLKPVGPPPTVILRAPRSSQEASAVLIALAAWPDEAELKIEGALPSRPYFEMTLRLVERFGVAIARSVASTTQVLRVRGPVRAPAAPIAVEPDASSAAVALAAACLSGGECVALGLAADSLQGDVRMAEYLRAFGCAAHFDPAGLRASGFPQRGAELDLSDTPDLAPVLAALAAGAALVAPGVGGRSVLRGLETLPRKESSRIDGLARGLRAAGWTSEARERELVIDAPPAGLSHEHLTLDPGGDHRMAFAFALLGLLRDRLDVATPDCVAKSWPDFWRDLQGLGAVLAR